MRKIFPRILSVLTLCVIALVAFAGVAFAQAATAGSGSADWTSMLTPVYEAFNGGHYAYAAALGVILLVALVKRYLSPKVPALTTDAGGAAMALTLATATAMATALAAPGALVTLALFKSSLLIGLGAAGGYAAIKALVITPLIKPLEAMAPAWMQPIFGVVLWIFDKSEASATAVADSVTAGNAAVAAKPATGAAGVTGTPTEIK